MGRDAARTPGADHRPGPVLPQRLPRLPLSYSQDEKALRLALEGIDSGMDRGLGAMERMFFWLPVGHSEDLALHERSVLHAEEEAASALSHRRAGADFGVSQAKAARDVRE